MKSQPNIILILRKSRDDRKHDLEHNIKSPTGYIFMKALLTLCLVLSVQSTIHHSNPPLPNFPSTPLVSAGGFVQDIGFSFGNQKIPTLINFINSGAGFYRDDILKNLQYVQISMQIAFARSDELFGVIIQTNSSASVTAQNVYNREGDTYASLAAGVCSSNPAWSYFVYITQTYRHSWTVQYAASQGHGKDLDMAMLDLATTAIQKHEGIRCTCKDLEKIRQTLEASDGQLWSIVCHSQPTLEGYVPMIRQQWMTIKPKYCYYLLYPLSIESK